MAFQQHIIIRAPTTLPMQMPIHMGIPIGIQPMVAFQTTHRVRPHYNHSNSNHNANPGVVQPIPGQPTTTVFIGNISERVPDNLIKQVLIKCGPIISWKRVQDASGTMQAFGFCEYRDPGATLRALRILKDLEIASKALLVKVDQKTKDLLDAHIKKKKIKMKLPENDNTLDERTKKEDAHVLREINAMINANKDLFAKENDDPDSTANKLADKALKRITGQRVEGETQDSNVNLEAERDSLVEREIRSFRDTYKDKQEERPRRRTSRDRSPRERSPRERSPRERSGSRARPRSPPRRVEERRRERSEERRRRPRRTPSRERERSKRRYDSAGGSDEERRSERRDEPSDEAQIRKKLDKKKRMRYDAYRKRLDGWELRERGKRREYETYEDHEAERKEEQAKERKKIAAFLEDYEDERDDEKYYRGSALSRRIRDREREIESDDRDRKKEKEEVEELRRRLQEEYPDKDPDELIAKLNRSEDSESEESPTSSPVHTTKPLVPNLAEISLPAQVIEPPSRDRSATPNLPPAPPATIIIKQPAMKAVPNASPSQAAGPVFGFQMKSKSSETGIQLGGKRKKLEVSSVFNQDEDEEAGDQSRKLKLSLPSAEDKRLTDSLIKNNPLSGKTNPLPHQSEPAVEEKPSISAEDKRKSIKQLIDKIPTQKDELFAYPIDWSVLDKDLMERRVKSWINKKIVEYIGEEEPSLCGFICSKVLAQSPPENILQDVAIVLEEEAEVFVVKMWRLLIYETEAKKLGLVK